ncbi:hypothetical protein [Sphingopyxis sp. KK2]|uniref:hypothetical protein n=1 Tax=Sphingopyxis sp. KK2 TaxID=1855727 RepID=UPI00118178B0|nr:hypothetical protein [Sphingopyxis sp. KK2]
MSLENWSPQRLRSARRSVQRGLEDRLRSLETKAPEGGDAEGHEASKCPGVRAKLVRRMLGERQMREQFFPAEFCTDPAWDILLDLYVARLEGRQVSATSPAVATAIPATTGARWIRMMTQASLLARQDDPDDGRRVFVVMTDPAFAAMGRYLDEAVA